MQHGTISTAARSARGRRSDAGAGQALHLTQRAYAYYESGQRMLPPQVLCALARYYGVSVDYLLGETDVRARYPAAKKP